mgnify:FL=1
MQQIPPLGFGTFRLEHNVAYRSVKMALEAGYRHIDTAQIYGNEREVGQAIKDSERPRDEIFVTTKVWTDNLTQERFILSVEDSLEKLQMAQVDLLLIHWPTANNASLRIALEQLIRAKEKGYSRHIGVSNFTIANMETALQVMPASEIFTNQVEVHPYLTNQRLLHWCKRNGIHVTGYMPFAVGKVLNDATIGGIAQKHGVSPATVVLGWELQQGLATIPSSTRRENMASNLDASRLVLSQDEMAAITHLNNNDRQAEPDFAPDWDA